MRVNLPSLAMLLLLPGFTSAQQPAKVTPPGGAPDGPEQVQKPIPFTDQELKVIRSANSLPTDRLVELMNVYDKLNNEAMTQILVRQVLKRNPKHPEALNLIQSLSSADPSRPASYLAKLSTLLLDGKKVDDPDGIAAQAGALLLENRAPEAVELLEALRKVNFDKQPFPYTIDLANAYQEAGQYEKAEVAYQAVIKDASSDPASKQEAQQSLPVLALQKRIGGLREEAMKNPDAGITLSKALLDELPKDSLAIGFYIECLDRAGRYDDAVQFLEGMKKKNTAGAFPYQETLAYAYYGKKDFSNARRLFREIKDSTAYDPEMRIGAEKMLVVLRMDEKIEVGAEALKKNEIESARKLLTELEQEFPNNPDVFAYRCLFMAKTGKSREALEMLLRMRNEAARKRELFKEMDTLADIYMERKEYVLAISAYDDIINNPAYDSATRIAASKAMEDAKLQQKLYKAYVALDDGDPATAKRFSEELQAAAPNDPDVRILGADIKLAYGKATEALAEYDELKARHYRNQPFPGQSGIAEAHFRLGEWEDALDAYDELLQRAGYEAEDVWSATWDRRSLLPYVKNHAALSIGVMDETEGTRFSQAVAYSTPWWNSWRLIVSAREDSYRLDDAVRFTDDGNVSRFEAQVALQRRFKGGYYGEISVGGTEDNILYGAKVGKFASTGVGWGGIAWSLGFSGNASADYSLPLEAINGRENRVDFNAAGYVHPRVRFDFNGYASWVHVDGDKLGHGYGARGSLDYIFQMETRRQPEIAVGYFGEYTRFYSESELPGSVKRQLRGGDLEVRKALAADDELKKALPSNHGREIFDALVEPETNRHGFQITLRKRLDLSWDIYAQAGVYRDFIAESWEYTFAAGVEYWMNDSTMLYAEVRYDSNGIGSSDEGTGVWEASLGAEVTF